MDPNDLALLLLRAGLGITIFLHGYNKVFRGGKLAGTAAWFESMGVRPGWLHARLAAATEMGSGVLLTIGFLMPFAGAGLLATMIVAGVTAHLANGFFIFRPNGGGWEYVFILGLAGAAVGTIGAGSISIDNALGWCGNQWWMFAVSFGLGIAGATALLTLFWRPGTVRKTS
jgi:putative oxidoreductase